MWPPFFGGRRGSFLHIWSTTVHHDRVVQRIAKVFKLSTDCRGSREPMFAEVLAYGANYRTVPIIEQKNTEKFRANME